MVNIFDLIMLNINTPLMIIILKILLSFLNKLKLPDLKLLSYYNGIVVKTFGIIIYKQVKGKKTNEC